LHEKTEPKFFISPPFTIMSFLQLDALHVFVTGAAGGIGSAIVDEFLGKEPPWKAPYQIYFHKVIANSSLRTRL